MEINKRPSPNYTKIVRKRIDMLVIHATAGSARGALRWLCDPKSSVSCHYLIDKKGKIYQLVDEKYKAWHCGRSIWDNETDCNRFSIGIELENNNKGEKYPDIQIQKLIKLSIDIINRHKIPLFRVVRHADITDRKTDPFGFPWRSYKATLKSKIKPIKNTVIKLSFWQKLIKLFRGGW